MFENNSNYDKNEVCERLRNIRKKTGLNQEEFYKKYLATHGIGDAKKDSSAQGFMKQLENGEKSITLDVLAVYADIDDCSLDSLVYGAKQKKNVHNRPLTTKEVCQMIVDINSTYPLVLIDNSPNTLSKNMSFRFKKKAADVLSDFFNREEYEKYEKQFESLQSFFYDFYRVQHTDIDDEQRQMLIEGYLIKHFD